MCIRDRVSTQSTWGFIIPQKGNMSKVLEDDEFLAFIKKNPKFAIGGKLDEEGFYTQTDGSFFDPDGYYFNPEGFDEFGGYYDEEGVYQDDAGEYEDEYDDENDHQYHEYERQTKLQHVISVIDSFASGTTFTAVLGNLQYRQGELNIKGELEKNGIHFKSVAVKKDNEGRTRSANVILTTKEDAKKMVNLHGVEFLGRSLKVEFPELSVEEGLTDIKEPGVQEIIVAKTEPVAVPKSTNEPVSKPPAEEVKKSNPS
eukprot:TRINITY_DN908_c0_g1_i1.p1 TRINITY_DN908_c0_g1~~TRINITY_DN908_c0_g1_i1.p1  ORF type:complete len:257 (+),score=79.63 TRINITY_DN908_c0_g1_i1:64-834(+)